MIIDIPVERVKNKTLVMGGGDNKVGKYRYATTETTLYINSDTVFLEVPLAVIVRKVVETFEKPPQTQTY